MLTFLDVNRAAITVDTICIVVCQIAVTAEARVGCVIWRIQTHPPNMGTKTTRFSDGTTHCSTCYQQYLDTINIHTLFRKLLQTTIPGSIIKLFAKYINLRKSYTTLQKPDIHTTSITHRRSPRWRPFSVLLCTHLHHTITGLKIYFTASIVEPLPNSEQKITISQVIPTQSRRQITSITIIPP